MKYIKNLSTGKDFNVQDGWTNKKIIIREIPWWCWKPIISKKIITWGCWQIILPHK